MATVERSNTDTVTITMNVAEAEKLSTVLSGVRDGTATHPLFKSWDDFTDALQDVVRYPSPLYKVEIYGHPLNKVWSIEYK